jgi:hypothetical protein
VVIPEVRDGATLPYYDLAESRLAGREVQDGGPDIKCVFYPLADHDVQIGVVRRRTGRDLSGQKIPIGEVYAKENVFIRFQLALGGRDVSAIETLSKEVIQQWLDCDLIIDGEVMQACRWGQDEWSVVMYLTPTLIIYAITPDDQVPQPIRLTKLTCAD